jgi:hypothetical protein
MHRSRYVSWLISSFSSSLLMFVLGSATTLALIYGGESGPELKSGFARAGRATVSDDSDTIHLTLDVPKPGEYTHAVVRDADHKELVILNVFRDGKYTVESAPLGPVRFYVQGFPSKALYMGGEYDQRPGRILRPPTARRPLRYSNQRPPQVFILWLASHRGRRCHLGHN